MQQKIKLLPPLTHATKFWQLAWRSIRLARRGLAAAQCLNGHRSWTELNFFLSDDNIVESPLVMKKARRLTGQMNGTAENERAGFGELPDSP
jgi:hypothetical protein